MPAPAASPAGPELARLGAAEFCDAARKATVLAKLTPGHKALRGDGQGTGWRHEVVDGHIVSPAARGPLLTLLLPPAVGARGGGAQGRGAHRRAARAAGRASRCLLLLPCRCCPPALIPPCLLITPAPAVGFLGDGANDAPALRNADVGISVNGGSDIAKARRGCVLQSWAQGRPCAGTASGADVPPGPHMWHPPPMSNCDPSPRREGPSPHPSPLDSPPGRTPPTSSCSRSHCWCWRRAWCAGASRTGGCGRSYAAVRRAGGSSGTAVPDHARLPLITLGAPHLPPTACACAAVLVQQHDQVHQDDGIFQLW